MKVDEFGHKGAKKPGQFPKNRVQSGEIRAPIRFSQFFARPVHTVRANADRCLPLDNLSVPTASFILNMLHSYAVIFGRTPALSQLEFEAVAAHFGMVAVRMLHAEILLAQAENPVSLESLELLQQTLGGTVRIAELFNQVAREKLIPAAALLVQQQAAPEGKLTIGINIWSDKAAATPAFRIAKPLKVALSEMGRGVRIVTPAEGHSQLGAAQLIHNKLVGGNASKTGKAMDLVCIATRGEWWIGLSRTVQDIEDYAFRDFAIPKPDPVSGMLPPKLAQTLINLGVGTDHSLAVYDPFCGNGRILLEAALLGIKALGSDLLEQQVDASKENLQWLNTEYGTSVSEESIWHADATQGPGRAIGHKFVIVTEPYLGKPLRAKLQASEKEEWLDELVQIYLKFFTYWSTSPEKPEKMIVIFPRALCQDGTEAAVFKRVVDRLNQVGYSTEVLFCYDRPDSLVRRDIVSIRAGA